MVTTARHLPSGTVTFVVTDIEGSTSLLRELGDDYVKSLLRHRELLRQAWAAWGGHEVDALGDGSLVAFGSARGAVLACRAAQRLLAEETWPSDADLRVRMGVHTGLAAPVGDHYVAVAVHQATRIASLGHGGQVVVSEDTARRLAGDRDVGLEPLGRYRVRDFDRPVGVHQLAVTWRAGAFPAVRALPADQHNLPTPATRLIGREDELVRLGETVATRRLVTVVGPGGVGKTRLVTELGIRTADRWPDGVWLVDCGRVHDPDLLPTALAETVGIETDGRGADWPYVRADLRRRRALLLLDGCERHLAAIAGMAESLAGGEAPLSVLATSIEPLHASGETVLRLGPLPVSATDDTAAVALFVERARAVRSDLVLTPTTLATVRAICRRLDGLPLALEIAAAKLTALHPDEIHAGLEHRFRLLREVARHRPARQRTLEGLLDWSVRLLNRDEATTLARLSLFAGPFDLDAAAAAAALDDVDPDSVPLLVWSLVDKSLVVADHSTAAAGTRYRLLESIRAYAAGHLDRAGDTAASAHSLARFYADQIGPGRGTGRQWVHAVASELANVREVVRRLGDTPVAQELACSLARHHDAVQSYRDGIVEATCLAATLSRPTPARVGLLTALGDLHLRVGELAQAQRLAHEAAQLRITTGAPTWDEVGVEKLLGELTLHGGDPAAAAAVAAGALERPLSPRGRARMYNLLGISLATLGATAEATAAFRGELQAAAEQGDDVLLAHAHANSAEMALREGDRAAAAEHQRTSLALALALGRSAMVGYALLASARIATTDPAGRTEDWATATRLAARAAELLDDVGATLHDTDRRVTERFLAAARRRLGADRFAAAEHEGRRMAVDVAIRQAEGILSRAVSHRRTATYSTLSAVGEKSHATQRTVDTRE